MEKGQPVIKSLRQNERSECSVLAFFLFVCAREKITAGLPDFSLVRDSETGKDGQINTKCTKWS
jgi:hypothetical protein